MKSLEKKIDELLKDLQAIRNEKESISQEHEDLLVLLSDQDAKCSKYKVNMLFLRFDSS